MGDNGDEDYVFYGTPIVREDELQGRKKRMALNTGEIRRLPTWKQEVTDEEGRRRFHGAFTGGFSAGFYNTVGSKEGWTPQSFTSSRKRRADTKGQTIYNFLDEDEKAELEVKELSASSQFDTFGFTAAEMARKQAEKELHSRPSAIPGPIPDEIIVPAAESVGVKLLVKMGWRQGRAIGARHIAALSESRREARKALLALSEKDESQVERTSVTQDESLKDDKNNDFEQDDHTTVHVPHSTPVFVIHPKNDLYGLGYDPFKNAPEFRERKNMQMSREKGRSWSKTDELKGSLFRPNAGKVGSGFGIGALEELDEEDEDIYASDVFIAQEEEDEQSFLSLEPKNENPVKRRYDIVPGFRPASISTCRTEWFNPPRIPPGFIPKHKFSVPLEVERKLSEPPPPDCAPPDTLELRMMIEGLATFVAKSGKIFEDLSREKNVKNPLFCFLFGGPGHDYYRRKLWEERKKVAESGKTLTEKLLEIKGPKMNSDERGRVLGETPLERSSSSASECIPHGDIARLQSVLSDTFTKPTLLQDAAIIQPFRSDPAKQARFEQFLNDKYKGGLRSTYMEGISDRERAKERLDFEATAEMIEKRNQSNKKSVSAHQHLDLVSTVENRFTSGGVETLGATEKSPEKAENTLTKRFPRREEHQWRPTSLLCKRFNLLDPYAGKPPPLPKARSKMDSLILISNPVKDLPETSSVIEDRSKFHETGASQSRMEVLNTKVEGTENEESVEVKDAVVKKPVDLYKAIFSDESDTELEETNEKQLDIQDKGGHGANATLNRLIAGDFLESLGKELGLKVPPISNPTQKGKNIPIQSKEPKQMADGQTSTENDKFMLPDCSTQNGSEEFPNANLAMSYTSNLTSDQKEANALRIQEPESNKDSKCNAEDTASHGNRKNNFVSKSSRHDAHNSGSSDYGRDKDNIKERKRMRESSHQERDKSHFKRHHRREHKSRDKYRREKRDRDKDMHEHTKRKKRKNDHKRKLSSSTSSSSSDI